VSATEASKFFEQSTSLVRGGPFYWGLSRTGILKRGSVQAGLLVAVAIWLPLLLLATVEALIVAGRVQVPFFLDPVPHVSYLITVPLLFFAEAAVDRAWAETVGGFEQGGFVPRSEGARFAEAVAEAHNGRDLVAVEAALLVAALGFSIADALGGERTHRFSSWLAPLPEAIGQLSLAGWWNTLVAAPLYTFLFYRWVWRLFLWARFLWRMTGLNLHLVAYHPDRAGGLGFLVFLPLAGAVLVFARAVTLAAVFSARILFAGAALADFRIAFAVFLVLALGLLLGPLLLFLPELARLRHQGILEYGAFAAEYGRDFRRKWIKKDNPGGDPPLGSSDIQSLADLGNSFEIVESMRVVPCTLRTVLLVVVAATLPMLPVLATVFPWRDILVQIVKLLF